MILNVFLPALLFVVVAVAVFLRRRQLAHAQALVLGGSIGPGCVIAQALALLAIAMAFLWFGTR
jgi:hypothetical protein